MAVRLVCNGKPAALGLFARLAAACSSSLLATSLLLLLLHAVLEGDRAMLKAGERGIYSIRAERKIVSDLTRKIRPCMIHLLKAYSAHLGP